MGKGFCYVFIMVLFGGFLWGCGNEGEDLSSLTRTENSSGGSSADEGQVGGGNSEGPAGSPYIREFPIPSDQSGNLLAPFGLAVDEIRGLIWFSADITLQENSPDQIGVFDLANETFPSCESESTTIQDPCPLVFPSAINSPQDQQILEQVSFKPRGLVFDPMEKWVWVSGFGTGVIGRGDWRNVFEFPIPTFESGPLGITLDSKGKVWFTESGKDQIGYLDPYEANTGLGVGFNEYSVSCQGPSGIGVDSKDNIWFSCAESNQIGKLDAAKNFVSSLYSIPTPSSHPVEVAVDSQDRVWFTERNQNKIGVFDPSADPGDEFSEFILPNGGAPYGITVDPDTDIVWFTEELGNRIGRLDPSVATPGSIDGITEFNIPTPNSRPTSIIIDEKKVIWFSETTGRKIGKLTPP